ncbi:MAG: DUF983 domain-containing protein [Asticcacaulis sp.]|nr:DUF983 domain-containing protein [Asticcacaulis sp.]
MRNGIRLSTALLRGLQRKCPCCGQASSFRGYLKVVDACPVCDTPLSLYPTDDGPAYLTILLIGHLIIAPAFFFPVVWENPSLTIPVMIAAIGVTTLIALPFIKGAFLGLLWYLGLKRAR